MEEKNKGLYEKVAENVKEIIMFDDQNSAFKSLKTIKDFLKRQELEKTDPEIFAAYKRLIVQLKWVALPLLKEDEIIEMFERHIGEALKMQYFDLEKKFRTVLVAVIMLHSERDVFKEKIKNILNKSQSRLTSIKLIGDFMPTAENWIKDYTASAGLNPVESVKFQNYFFTNNNIKKLSQEEKERMKIFFQFYERLKLSSMTVAGIEETVPIPVDDEGTIGYIRDGKIEKDSPLPPDVQRIFDAVMNKGEAAAPAEDNRLKDLQVMLGAYPAGSLERKVIEEEIRKINKS